MTFNRLRVENPLGLSSVRCQSKARLRILYSPVLAGPMVSPRGSSLQPNRDFKTRLCLSDGLRFLRKSRSEQDGVRKSLEAVKCTGRGHTLLPPARRQGWNE